MKKTVLCFTFGVLALFVLGTFFDLAIAGAVYNPGHLFPRLFQLAGALPQYGIIIAAPAMIGAFLYANRAALKPAPAFFTAALALAVTALNIDHIIVEIEEHIALPRAMSIAIILAMLAGCFLVSYRYLTGVWTIARRADGSAVSRKILSPDAANVQNADAANFADALFIVALIGLAACFAGSLVVDSIKTQWGRQRYFTMDDAPSQFTPWYEPVAEPEAPATDDFKSFPSGHSFSAMLALWFALFPRFIPLPAKRKRTWTHALFAAALIFALLTMFSRLVYGRHFLSDVTAGALIALAALAFFRILVDKNSGSILGALYKR
jgi:membrane-associated phospholipid phosphatase